MNIQLVDDALADIALNPENHDQGNWVCGSKMCLAGFIAVRAGWEIVQRPGTTYYYAVKDGVRARIYNAAEWEAGLTMEQADYLFLDSHLDDYKELVVRWNKMCGREL